MQTDGQAANWSSQIVGDIARTFMKWTGNCSRVFSSDRVNVSLNIVNQRFGYIVSKPAIDKMDPPSASLKIQHCFEAVHCGYGIDLVSLVRFLVSIRPLFSRL
jgi:hypothetical protein